MEYNGFDANALSGFFRGGCGFLFANKEAVNALNVFPVPDGDTGINMSLTVNSALRNIAEPSSMQKMAQDFSMGALMGARGNSGVILSQIFRGFSQGIVSVDKSKMTAGDLAFSLQKGVDLAYKSVMKPVEGTILTVFREFTAAAVEKSQYTEDVIAVLEYALEKGEEALANTPEQLPVLKEAGVVDAGGRGLLYIFEGGLRALKGEKFDELVVTAVKKPATAAAASSVEDVEFIYCTEFLIRGNNLNPEKIKASIIKSQAGDCLLVVGMEDIVKVHYHNNNPGNVLAAAVKYGTLHDLKIENMLDQHTGMLEEAPVAPPVDKKKKASIQKCGVLAVCAGDGMKEIFESLGAHVLSGGQTMNPSAEELLNAIDEIPADEVVILPNNSNIILTAEQTQKLSRKPAAIVRTKFVTQGIASMMGFGKDSSALANESAMADSCENIASGEITYAVRDSRYNGFEIRENDILGLAEGKIVLHGSELKEILLGLLEQLVDEDKDEQSLISLLYGNDLDEDTVEKLAEAVEDKYPDMDVEYHYGGQPLYYFLISVE